MQNTWIFSEKIPEAFGIKKTCEISEPTVVSTPELIKEDYRPAIIPEFSEKQPLLEEIVAEIGKYQWDTAIALKIAKCESGFNSYAINYADAEKTGFPSMGIFQLNRPYDVKYFDYKENIRIAYEEFYLKRFWRPWSCAYLLEIL